VKTPISPPVIEDHDRERAHARLGAMASVGADHLRSPRRAAGGDRRRHPRPALGHADGLPVTHTAPHPRAGRVAYSTVALVWPFIAVVGFVVFVAALIAAGLGDPGYSALSDGVGGLGARNVADPGVMDAGFVALAVATVAAGIALVRLLPRRSGLAASMIVILAGVAASGLAFVRQDCSTARANCVDTGLAGDLSTAHTVHRILAVGIALALVVGLLMMATSLRGSLGAESLTAITTWVSVASVCVFIWYGSELYGAIGGAIERLLMALVYGWPVFLAVALSRRRSARLAAGSLALRV
jgi:hypothetical protein